MYRPGVTTYACSLMMEAGPRCESTRVSSRLRIRVMLLPSCRSLPCSPSSFHRVRRDPIALVSPSPRSHRGRPGTPPVLSLDCPRPRSRSQMRATVLRRVLPSEVERLGPPLHSDGMSVVVRPSSKRCDRDLSCWACAYTPRLPPCCIRRSDRAHIAPRRRVTLRNPCLDEYS